MLFSVLFFVFIIGGITVNAEEEVNDPEEVLKIAFDALVHQDMETYAKYVENLIFPDEDTALKNYKLLSKESTLVRYEIIRTISSEEGHVRFLVEEEYATGFTVRAAVHVKKFGKNWKVFIPNETTPDDAQFGEVIKPDRTEQLSNPILGPLSGIIWKNFSGTISHNISSVNYGSPPSRALILNVRSMSSSRYGEGEFYMQGIVNGGWREISKKIRISVGSTGSISNRMHSMGLDRITTSSRLHIQHYASPQNHASTLKFSGYISY